MARCHAGCLAGRPAREQEQAQGHPRCHAGRLAMVASNQIRWICSRSPLAPSAIPVPCPIFGQGHAGVVDVVSVFVLAWWLWWRPPSALDSLNPLPPSAHPSCVNMTMACGGNIVPIVPRLREWRGDVRWMLGALAACSREETEMAAPPATLASGKTDQIFHPVLGRATGGSCRSLLSPHPSIPSDNQNVPKWCDGGPPLPRENASGPPPANNSFLGI